MLASIPKSLHNIVLLYITLSAVSVSGSSFLPQQLHRHHLNLQVPLVHSSSPTREQQQQHQQQQPLQQQPTRKASASATQDEEEHRMADPNSLNVFQNPLAFFSKSPLTGFMRNGYCEVPASDFGNHSVAAELSEEFLDYTMQQGNDLRQIGLKGGCKWCICASRWQEALQAHRDGKIGEKAVPKVWLEATNRRALEKLDLKDLKGFAVDRKD